ncbi:abortive infection family protein [Hymenobacter mucosus]|nr:abortive infection family protein [Hymenobacter mucosus]
MSSLQFQEKTKLEKLFRMSTGFVLGFNNGTLQSLVASSVGLNILDEKYSENGTSKANRLRVFWRQEPDHVVGTVLRELLAAVPKYWEQQGGEEEIPEDEKEAYIASQQTYERLLGVEGAEHLQELKAVTYDDNFRLLARQVVESIERGEPATGLDRLHTFLIKYFRQLCSNRGIPTTREETLNAVFGKYVNVLEGTGRITSDMSLKILKFSVNLLSSFNAVRNNESLAHDNSLLNREESFLIFRNITALIKFVESIEEAAATT